MQSLVAQDPAWWLLFEVDRRQLYDVCRQLYDLYHQPRPSYVCVKVRRGLVHSLAGSAACGHQSLAACIQAAVGSLLLGILQPLVLPHGAPGMHAARSQTHARRSCLPRRRT